MPRPLSDDLRIRMVNAVQNAESRHAAAERFDVAPSPVIREMIEARGAFPRYLPACSPDLNPIAQSLPRT